MSLDHKRGHKQFNTNASGKSLAIGFGYDERFFSKKNYGEHCDAGHDEKGHQQLDPNFKPIQINAPRLIAEFIREFGWSLDVVLSTPAPTFFALLQSARQMKREETAVQLRELCDIMAISWGDKKYLDALKSSYSEMTMSPEQLAARRNPRVFDVSVDERAQGAAQMFKQFLGQSKKMGGAGV